MGNLQIQTQSQSNEVTKGVSSDAQLIAETWEKALVHYFEPETRDTVIKKFYRLSATWQDATSVTSSIQEIVMQPAYQEIVGMGKIALPLIFRVMKIENNHWFWALRAITGEDPVKPQNRGNIKNMTQDWFDWGKENGYI